MKHIRNWMYRPAEWYQFWLPQSGITGGILAYLIIFSVLVIGDYWYG